MWTKRLASFAFASCCAVTSLAEPRIAGMDAQLEADLARSSYLFVWDLDMATIGRGDPYRTGGDDTTGPPRTREQTRPTSLQADGARDADRTRPDRPPADGDRSSHQ